MILVRKDNENTVSEVGLVNGVERKRYTIVEYFNVYLGRIRVICSILVKCLPEF